MKVQKKWTPLDIPIEILKIELSLCRLSSPNGADYAFYMQCKS